MKTPPSNLRFNRGFTVLEMIVVMVISSLLVGVVLGAFGVVLQTQERVGRVGVDLVNVMAEQNRVRYVLSGIFPEQEKRPAAFKGGTRSLSGLTQHPLLGWKGLPTPFELEWDYDLATDSTYLIYTEGEREPISLLTVPGDNGAFGFATESLRWSSSWPPMEGSELLQPTLVQVSWGVRADETLVVFTAGLTDLPLDPADLLNFQ